MKIVKNDYGTKVQESLKDYQKKMNLPGFRVGKVPMSIVKSKYELAIRVEEINKIFSEHNLIKMRVKVEIEWFIFLSNQKSIES